MSATPIHGTVAHGFQGVADAVENKLEVIASGQAVAIASASVGADRLRPDVTR